MENKSNLLNPKSISCKNQKEIVNRFFSSKFGIIFTGAFIGIVATILQYEGNPGNMGFCVACFERDIAGALGLHSKLAYLRPEILGFILGSFGASLVFKEFRTRSGSAPMIRFVLGFFSMVGALVFLGCPWRAFLRLAGGDLNAVLGIAGLTFGIYLGTIFIKNGFNLGRSGKGHPLVGLVLPAIALILVVMIWWDPSYNGVDALRYSGVAHAAIGLSLAIGIAVGFFAQRTRFCTVGGIRDMILIRDHHLLLGIIALVTAAFISNLALGQVDVGFEDQPAAHDEHLWNFLGMTLAGLGFVLAGGCPGRQLILSGEGNADSGVFVVGMLTGAAFSHNFWFASSPNGTTTWGQAAVLFGFAVFGIIGYFMRDS